MKQLMDLTVLQIKRRLLVEIRSQVKLNPFLFAIWGICGLAGCSSWYETLERTLSAFFPLLSVSLIKVLLKAVRDKEMFHFTDGGGISRGFFACVHDRWKMLPKEVCTSGSQALHVQMHLVNTERKIPWPPAWELPYFVPLQAHELSLYYDNVSWQAQVSQFEQHRVHLSPTGSWLKATTDCQSWFPNSTPSPGDTWKYIEVCIIYNRFGFLLFISWNML